MKLPAVNYTNDIVIQSTVNDHIQSRDTIKNFKIVEELNYFQYLSCKKMLCLFFSIWLQILNAVIKYTKK